MGLHLIVRTPFGGYSKGDRITDAAAVAEVLAGESEGSVVRVAAPDAPEPEVEQER